MANIQPTSLPRGRVVFDLLWSIRQGGVTLKECQVLSKGNVMEIYDAKIPHLGPANELFQSTMKSIKVNTMINTCSA